MAEEWWRMITKTIGKAINIVLLFYYYKRYTGLQCSTYSKTGIDRGCQNFGHLTDSNQIDNQLIEFWYLSTYTQLFYEDFKISNICSPEGFPLVLSFYFPQKK